VLTRFHQGDDADALSCPSSPFPLNPHPQVYTDNAHACDPPLSAATSSKEAMSEAVKV
jgi:hypothetical protein